MPEVRMNEIEVGTRYLIIGVTGMPGSGKGEVCEHAADKGIPVRALGDVVREHFHSTHPDGNMRDIGEHASEQRRIHGEDIWALRLVEDIQGILEEGKKLVMIDGVRSPSEVKVFRDRWGDSFSILCIHSSPSTRFGRLSSRGRGDDPEDRDEFDRRDIRELSWGLGNVIARADLMIINEGEVTELVREFDEIRRNID